jgi:hypothetical protein
LQAKILCSHITPIISIRQISDIWSSVINPTNSNVMPCKVYLSEKNESPPLQREGQATPEIYARLKEEKAIK